MILSCFYDRQRELPWNSKRCHLENSRVTWSHYSRHGSTAIGRRRGLKWWIPLKAPSSHKHWIDDGALRRSDLLFIARGAGQTGCVPFGRHSVADEGKRGLQELSSGGGAAGGGLGGRWFTIERRLSLPQHVTGMTTCRLYRWLMAKFRFKVYEVRIKHLYDISRIIGKM